MATLERIEAQAQLANAQEIARAGRLVILGALPGFWPPSGDPEGIWSYLDTNRALMTERKTTLDNLKSAVDGIRQIQHVLCHAKSQPIKLFVQLVLVPKAENLPALEPAQNCKTLLECVVRVTEHPRVQGPELGVQVER